MIRLPPLLRKLAARVLPEAVRQRWARRRYGYGVADVAIPFTRTTGRDGWTRFAIEGIQPLTVPEAASDTFEFHLVSNAASIEELHALMVEARRRDGLLLDVGANHGLFSLVFCAARRGNRAVAFEPGDELADVLEGAARANGMEDRIRCERRWVGAGNGDVRGFIDGSGFFARDESAGGRSVRQVTLDGYVATAGVRPTVVKVDVDGAEREVLRGAVRTLREHHPVVFLEIHHDLLAACGVDSGEVIEVLSGAGYRFQTPLGAPLSARSLIRDWMAVRRLVAVPA